MTTMNARSGGQADDGANHRDAVSRLYYTGEPSFDVAPGRTALVIIDMQYLDAHRDYGFGVDARAKGVEGELTHRFDQIDCAIPNIQKVLYACRAAGIEVVHVRVAGLTRDGRDAPLGMRRPGMPPHVDSKEAQILDELAPIDDEIVLSKTTVSVFTSTNIDFILRNIGIQNLLVCGIVTNGCVELAVRDAADRDYRIVVIGDGCAANDQQAHDDALTGMNQYRTRVKSADEVVQMIQSAVPQAFAASSAAD